MCAEFKNGEKAWEWHKLRNVKRKPSIIHEDSLSIQQAALLSWVWDEDTLGAWIIGRINGTR